MQFVGEVRGSRCVPRCKAVGFALREIKNCGDLQALVGGSPGGSVQTLAGHPGEGVSTALFELCPPSKARSVLRHQLSCLEA